MEELRYTNVRKYSAEKNERIIAIFNTVDITNILLDKSPMISFFKNSKTSK